MSDVSVVDSWARRYLGSLPIDEDEFADHMEDYRDHHVPADEAAKCAVREVLEGKGVSWKSWEVEKLTVIPDLQTDAWVSVIATVIDCDTHGSEKVRQVGTLRDEDGNTVEYIVWGKSDADSFELNRTYAISNAHMDRHDGSLQLQINSGTTVQRLVRDDELQESTQVVVGEVIDVNPHHEALLREIKPCLQFDVTVVTEQGEQDVEVPPSVAARLENLSVDEARAYLQARYTVQALGEYLRNHLLGAQWRVEGRADKNGLTATSISVNRADAPETGDQNT